MIEEKGKREVETISVIVPIYNVEKYLANCLESLLAQTHTELEVILVNDGSKDQSLEICKTYAEKDKRIVVIDKVNEGVSIARNTGLEAATGEYVAFIDPDDWVEPEAYASMLSQIKKWESPVCLCNFYKDTKRRSQPKCFEFTSEVLEGEEVREQLINNMIGMPDLLPKYVYVMGSVWRGLYSRSFLNNNALRFVPKLTIMEDLVFMVQTLLKCDRVAIDQGIWYHYVQHAASTLHTYNGQLWEDQLVVYELLEQSLKEAHLEGDMRNRLDMRYIGMVLTAIKNETYTKKDGDFKDTLAHIKEIFTDETLKNVLERIKPIQVDKVAEKNGSRSEERLLSKGKVKATKKVRKNDKLTDEKLRQNEGLTKDKLKKSKKLTTERSKKGSRKTLSTSLYNKSKDRYNE